MLSNSKVGDGLSREKASFINEYEVVKVVEELVKGLEALKNTERFKIIKVLYNKGSLFFSQIRAEIGCSPSKAFIPFKSVRRGKNYI
jgi:hypothetical protein